MKSTETLTSDRRPPKAGRTQVFDAADKILRGGQRPTVDAIKALLGGGSPNSIVAYLGEWYGDLSERLKRADTPAEGLSREVHQAALILQRSIAANLEGEEASATETLINGLRAETASQKVLLLELRDQRSHYLQRLADARALLASREEDLQELRGELLNLKAALAVADDRLRRRAIRSAPRTAAIQRLRKEQKPSKSNASRAIRRTNRNSSVARKSRPKRPAPRKTKSGARSN